MRYVDVILPLPLDGTFTYGVSTELAPRVQEGVRLLVPLGRSKRYATTGKNPLTCVELKCPEEVTDKAAYFREELEKLTKDIEISRPAMPKGMYLLSEDNLKVSYDKKEGTVSVWLTLKAEGFTEKRGELYSLTSEIDKCLAFNRALLSRQSQ